MKRSILRLSLFLAIGFSPSDLHVYNSAICKKGDRLFHRHFLSIFIVVAFPAYADSCIELVPHRNQLPMPGIFLELELESACILESGVYGFSTNLTRSNTTTISPDNNLIFPRLILDHEREEMMVKVEAGLGSGWDLNIRLRYLKDWVGDLDHFMRQFHQVTGLPYESRKVRPDGKFLYWQYRPENNDNEKSIWITKTQHGPGDYVLSLGKQHGGFLGSSEVKWSTRLVYKHPSADDLPTISSGKRDYGISTAAEGSGVWWDRNVQWLVNLGLVHAGETEHTLYEQNRTFFSGGGGVSTSFNDDWTITIQNLIASPRYHAPGLELKGMNQWQSILAVGIFYHLKDQSLMLAFTEDLLTNHSEDFSLIFSWKGQFGK